jgi:hypothetical protein
MRIIYHTTLSENLRLLAELAKCLGITVELCDLQHRGPLASELSASAGGFVLDVASLKEKCAPEELDECTQRLKSSKIAVLLLVTTADLLSDQWLNKLTNGGVRGSRLVTTAASIDFPNAGGGLSGELATQDYSRKSGQAIVLDVHPKPGAEVVMQLDRAPAFMRVPVGCADIFVWSTCRIFDMGRALEAEKEFECAADEYVPAIIFLRHVFGDRCWHNPSPGAGIVIDDPLLNRKYGFINFPQLLESARKNAYHVTLAFIPWNHWRSSAAKARMFLDHADCFSICAHGCDHTNKEFGSADYGDLLNRNFVASERMDRHHDRTGLVSEPLMVCPQEQYSLEAMRAFADSRKFIGLVCTACMPRNLTTPQICGADLLLPAQDSFFGFPVFKRHYWTDISVFAMALFLGKPAILVEHHEFFRGGPGGAEKFASELSKVHPGIQWTSLIETARRTHLRRRVSENRHEVRFFTDDFKLEHTGEKPAEYQLIRRIPETTSVRRMTVNGVEAPFDQTGGWLACEIQAGAPQTLRVQVQVAPIQPKKPHSRSLKYQASVVFRRGLSEFRDNVMARNDFVLRTAKSLAKSLKQTGN